MSIEQAIALGLAWMSLGWDPRRPNDSPAAFSAIVMFKDGTAIYPVLRLGYPPLSNDGAIMAEYGQTWSYWVPDLRDDGTRGHALAQVRRAWRDPRASLHATSDGFEVVGHVPGDDSKCVFGRGPAEAEALLAARKAAPQ